MKRKWFQMSEDQQLNANVGSVYISNSCGFQTISVKENFSAVSNFIFLLIGNTRSHDDDEEKEDAIINANHKGRIF